MTLYVKTITWDHATDTPAVEPGFIFKLEGKEDMATFLSLLNRSLNCAPEFGRDWFELADKLEAFLKTIA